MKCPEETTFYNTFTCGVQENFREIFGKNFWQVIELGPRHLRTYIARFILRIQPSKVCRSEVVAQNQFLPEAKPTGLVAISSAQRGMFYLTTSKWGMFYLTTRGWGMFYLMTSELGIFYLTTSKLRMFSSIYMLYPGYPGNCC